MSKRRWKSWPDRIFRELNSVSGVATVGGILMGIAGWAILAGAIGDWLGYVGAAIACVSFAYAVLKAIPPVIKSPGELIGQSLQLEALENVWPPIRKLAIVGASRVGKTTLRNRLEFEPSPNERTQWITATIVPVPKTPHLYVAILDGGGEKYSQQFKIAESCEHLCVIIDHNPSDCETSISPERQEEHSKFLKQIRYHLKESKALRKHSVEILVNKRDLWKLADEESRNSFVDFYSEQERKWADGNFAEVVKLNPHSNKNENDIARFVRDLRNELHEERSSEKAEVFE